MGKNSSLKELRAQLRNIVKEELSDIIAAEIHHKLILKIEQDLEKKLKAMDERHRDAISMLIRNSVK